jgi:ABC-type nitrate/sulfonate/bicarbonate transport system substrate-binding protein
VRLALSLLCALAAAPALASERELRFGLSVADNVVYAPVLAAEELGYFKAVNLSVRVVPLRGASAAGEALARGHVDLADYTIPYAARAVADGADLRVAATASNGFYGWSLIVRAESPVRTVRDLVGHRIGVGARQSISEMAARRLMDQTSATFQLEPTGPGAMIPALRTGAIDGLLFSAAVAQREVFSENARTILELSADEDRTAIYGYATSEAALEKKGPELRAFFEALRRATVAMQTDRVYSVRFIRQFIRVNDNQLAELLHDRVVARLSKTGESRPDSVARALSLAARAWDAPALADMPPERVFTNELLNLNPS